MTKHNTLLKAVISLLLGAFLYIATPTIDDAVTIPLISYIFKLPILLTLLVYYGVAWLIVFGLSALLKNVK